MTEQQPPQGNWQAPQNTPQGEGQFQQPTDQLTPVEQVQPSGDNSRRKWLVWGTAAAAVPVIALGTFFGVSLMQGGESGSDSPDKAANDFIAALNANDVTRASQFIVPEESTGLTSLMDQGAKKAQDQSGGKSSPNDLMAGISIKTTGLKTTVSDLPVPAAGVKKIEFTDGNIDTSYNPAKADPVMKDFITAMDGNPDRGAKQSGTIADARKETGKASYIVAVQRGDSWYISPTYTSLEHHAADEGVKPASTATAVKTKSYASAEEASTAFVKGLVASGNSGDIKPLLETLSPYEAQMVQRYQPLFDEQVGGGGSDSDSDERARVITSKWKKPTNDGDRVRILPEDLQIGATEGGGPEEVLTIQGGCAIVEGESSCAESRIGRLINQHAKGLVVKRGPAGWNVEYLPSMIAVTSDIVSGASKAEIKDAAEEA